MRSCNSRPFQIFLFLFSIILGSSAAPIKAQVGIGISPPRIEVVIPSGKEKTVGLTVGYSADSPEIKLPIARMVARLEDWSVGTDGNIMLGPIGTLPRSATNWVTSYSPAEFALTGDAPRQIVRFTIKVPEGTPPGDYYFGCYIENRNAPPPPKTGERQININFRYYSLVYVMVPGLTRDASLQNLETKVVNGYPVIVPQMSNKGNSRVRPQHAVEICDAAGQKVFSSPMSEALAVLGGHTWQIPYPIDIELPAGIYKLQYTVDFGDKKELQVGKTEFVITEGDIAARNTFKTKAAEALAQRQKAMQPAPPVAATTNASAGANQPPASAKQADAVAPSSPTVAEKTAPSAAPNGQSLAPPTGKKP